MKGTPSRFSRTHHVWFGFLNIFIGLFILSFHSSAQLPGIEWGAYFDAEASIPASYFQADEELIDQIAVDTSGGTEFIYAVGRTKSIYKTTDGKSMKDAGCLGDTITTGQKSPAAFLAKYDAGGNLLWTRYLGTDGSFPYFNGTFAYCLALDHAGGKTWIYVGGEITNGHSKQFNAFSCDTTCIVSVYDTQADDDDEGFVAKYDGDGQLLRWTYVGGSNPADTFSMDEVLGIAVHPVTHDVFITGYTESTNFGSSGQATSIPYFDNTVAGKGDFMLASFNSCLQMTWFSYYGGAGIQSQNKQNDGQERGHGIKIFHSETEDFMVITGTVESNGLAVNANYDGTYAGSSSMQEDAFIMRWNLSSLTAGPAWANYLGAGPADRGRTLDFDRDGNIYWTGWTLSTGLAFPAGCSSNLAQATKSGKEDAFIAKFDKNGFAKWITYYGGNGDEEDNAIKYYMPPCPPALVIISGLTTSGNLPHIPATYAHSTLNGGSSSKYDDVFIAAVEDRDVCTEMQSLKFSTYLGGKDDEHNHATLSYGPYLEIGKNMYVSYSTKTKSADMLDNAAAIKGTFNKGCCGGLSNTDGFIQKFYPFTFCRTGDDENTPEAALDGRLLIYPTLATSSVHCRIYSEASEEAIITLFDLCGRKLQAINITLGEGSTDTEMDLSGISPGFYFVTIQTTAGTRTVKITKQ